MQSGFVAEGIDCADCANTVRDALLREPGVRDAVVSALTGKVSVMYDGSLYSDDKVLETLNRIGLKGPAYGHGCYHAQAPRAANAGRGAKAIVLCATQMAIPRTSASRWIPRLPRACFASSLTLACLVLV